MCAICTDGFRVAFFANKVAFIMFILYLGLIFHYTAVDDDVLSRGYGKVIQLVLDTIARLSMYESYRRRICRPHVCLLRCLVTVLTPFFADACFIRLRGRTPGVKMPHNRF